MVTPVKRGEEGETSERGAEEVARSGDPRRLER